MEMEPVPEALVVVMGVVGVEPLVILTVNWIL
jgi:hypothetical protein